MADIQYFNLKKQTQTLLRRVPSSHAAALTKSSTRQELLTTLSNLLTVPSLTLIITTLYRPLLLDLCSRWLNENLNGDAKLAGFALLLEIHPEIFPAFSAFLRRFDFQKGPLAFVDSPETVPTLDTQRLHTILLAYYRILRANRELPTRLSWPLKPLSLLMWAPHPDPGVRFLAIRCYALQSGMGEAERVKTEKQIIGEVAEMDCPIYYGQNIDGSPAFLDGWLLPLIDTERVVKTRQALLEPQDYYTSEDGSSIEPIHPAELSPYIANIHGVLMFCEAGVSPLQTNLIATPSTVAALRTLAIHLSLGVPMLLTSSPSSGKSLLLSHLASVLYPNTKNHIVTIHLADTSLDPRSLLGSYVSSTTSSGTFEWKEGVLVRAMREGKWVVFEDIDRGSSEVLGLIKPLVESLSVDGWVGGRAVLQVPSRGKVVAHESFAIFATRSLLPSRNGKFPTATFFGAHKIYEVEIASPAHEDLRMILDARFPRLSGAANEGLILLWEAVRSLGTASSVRDVGLRELEKICLRVDNLLPATAQSMDVDIEDPGSPSLSSVFPNINIREDILFEIRDVLFGAGVTTASARSHLDAVAATVADHLGLAPERRDWVLAAKIPEFQADKDVNGGIVSVRFGRTRLQAAPATVGFELPPARTFAMHKPATLLMSRIATAVSLNEPLLLTGETGTGKTSVVTHLASLLRKPLISLNLSHQTESSDIVGGFKPIDARVPASELQERFLALFGGTFSRKRNAKFDESVRKAVLESKWKRAVALWIEAVRMAKDRIQAKAVEDQAPMVQENEGPRKRRKTEQNVSLANWEEFERDVRTFEVQHVQGNGKFAFGFVEGPLVRALRFGHWILLDEINLASAETLECISSLLHSPTASITLTEQGSLEPVVRHPDFRLFACMNPATDVGKKDLPPNIRSRFTEIDVPPPDADQETLLSIVAHYIGPYAVGDKGAIMDVAEFYTAVRKLAEKREIADGSNHRPHFSMRTLARALTFVADMAGTHSLRRALWEGCLMAFTMVLDEPSTAIVTALAQKHILSGVRNPRSLLAKEPLPPQGRSTDDFVKFGPFFLARGPLPENPMDEYIMTPSVERKLIDLARIITTRRFPVLIEGPTSSGKTSSIEYLAKRTGHRFVRINNHEHTDIQEYLGTYISDPTTGKLVFKDGLLVRALRNGDWIVLDELNLAPTDVLEALNRLLDDNRELVIPETQEVVRPHPHFLLFATQNPSGLYGGRKVLSRAFRNRFLEVHFEDVPQAELETILCQRCKIAPSYAARIVTVFQELQRRRQSSRIFESKHGFATLRDLFRWAGRDAIDYQELAENGYMLLAERARKPDDKAVAKEVIESVMKVKIDESRLYQLHDVSRDSMAYLGCPIPESSQLVWTSAMQRLFILVARALKFHEPVLLVGETGCGKTSVCQLYAEILSRRLHAVNCHQNTETADLIGGLRPLRNRAAMEADITSEAQQVLANCGVLDHISDTKALASSIESLLKSHGLDDAVQSKLQGIRARLRGLSTMFQWYDGPLVDAMRNGEIFLLDEISLADDSVLERLNSVLEPSRTIVLAERGDDGLSLPMVTADERFELVATMNPGGDYGKKELSPALRNRFTEIWVPPVDDRRDLEQIVCSMWKFDVFQVCTEPLLDFTEWLSQRISDRSIVGLRDILAWVEFSNAVYSDNDSLSVGDVFHHAAHMTFLDGLSSLPQLSAHSASAIDKLRRDAMSRLDELFPVSVTSPDLSSPNSATHVQLGSFFIPKGPNTARPNLFSFQAPTTRDNVSRVVRACQLSKPVLLEGSPGVGKTSLVAALANICGYNLCRINLSDQTDLVDLFGSDLPVEGGSPGQFAWKDAEFLRAMQEGHWVLLDEMNLAPQAILEGLNAVLDHRGTVYIPELGRSFTRHPSFRIFAAQNPLHQGGGRKGLPKSFLNRFTKVYVQELSSEDVLVVCRNLFAGVPDGYLHCMVSYTSRLQEEVMVKRTFGREGSPWEFNLRDVIRWGSLVQASGGHPGQYLHIIFLRRFRTAEDREQAKQLFRSMFPDLLHGTDVGPRFTITPSFAQFGRAFNPREQYVGSHRPGQIIHSHLPPLESLGMCVMHGWLSILTGPLNSGKTTLVRTLASLTGHTLHEIHINAATDASDILGSFEEVDLQSHLHRLVHQVLRGLAPRTASMEGSKLLMLADHAGALRMAGSVSKTDALSLLEAIRQIVKEFPDDTADLQHTVSTLEVMTTLHSSGRFEWVDGPLVNAVRNGHWVLLDGANLCNPSVLDRLNSLCEGDGQLTLNERGAVNGLVQVLKPHPDFRLFMTVDPRFGELSRAMRNRGIEIALLPPCPEDRVSLSSHMRVPMYASSTDVPPSQSLIIPHTYRRKGILLEEPLSADHPITFYCCPLGEDSACTSLSQLLPECYEGSSQTVPIRSLSYFLTQSIPFAYVSLLRRLARHLQHHAPLQDLLDTLANSRALSFTTMARQEKSGFDELPLELRFAQPMDLQMHRFTLGVNLSVDMVTINMLLIRLTAVLSLSRDHLSSFQNQTSLKPSTHHIVLEAITGTIRSIIGTAQQLCSSEVAVDERSRVSLSLILRFLDYSEYLQGIATFGVLDYSALQAALTWMLDAFRSHPSELESVQSNLHALKDAIALHSGLGMSKIWAVLSSGIRVQCTVEDMRLDHSAYGMPSDQRSSVLELIALRQLSTDGQDHRQLLQQLTERVSVRTQTLEGMDAHSRSSSPLDPYVHILELGLMEAISKSDTERSLKQIQWRLRLAYEDPTAPILRLAPYKCLLWLYEAGKAEKLPVIARLYKDWLEALWTISITEEITGPTLLHIPIQLFGVVQLCDWTTQTLSGMEVYESNLRRRSALILSQTGQPKRVIQLTMMLLQSILMVVSPFGDGFEDQTVLLLPLDFEAEWQAWLGHLCSSVAEINYDYVAQSFQNTLEPALRRLQNGTQDTPEFWNLLGQCFVKLCHFFTALYVPDRPVDPAAIEQCTHVFREKLRCSLSTEIAMHEGLERRTSGQLSNGTIVSLAAERSSIPATLSGTRSGPSRSDVSRLHSYWAEVDQLFRLVLAPHKVDAFVTHHGPFDSSMVQRESIIQESVSGFCQRLDTVYPEFGDLNHPLQLGLQFMKLGLRLLLRMGHTHMDLNSSNHRLVSSTTAFPSVKGAEMFHFVRDSSPRSFEALVAQVAAVAFETSVGVNVSAQMPSLSTFYEQALGLWLVERAREAEHERESQSLYKSKVSTSEGMNDAELEEEEFRALFPEFGDVLEEAPAHQGTSSPKRLLDPELVLRLFHIHLALFTAPTLDSLTAVNCWYAKSKQAILQGLIETQLGDFPESLDGDALPLQVSLLHHRFSSFRTSTATPTPRAPRDFYTEPNVTEAKRFLTILTAFVERLDELIVEWPDQMVLHNLKSRCEAALKLSVHSPVAKFLAALEQLLTQSEDWETFANRSNTIKPHQQAFTSLIVEWRRMELSAWQDLLEIQARRFTDGLSEWWFRLYEVCIHGLTKAVHEADGDDGHISEYLDTLIPLLEDYITSGPLGQFALRMRLLHSFETYAELLSPHQDPPERQALQRVYRIIRSLRQYYGQFEVRIASSLVKQRDTLEADIRGFIKIASWRDINVQALRQSAQKTHHQLYKNIRKFRDVLRQPIQDLLHTSMSDFSPEESQVLQSSSQILRVSALPDASSQDVPQHLANLSTTFDRFTSFVGHDLKPFLNSHIPDHAEALAGDIISAAKSLSESGVPAGVEGDQRSKFLKNLLQRKRKAWSDMLKELKRAGLAANIKPEVLQQQRSVRWLHEQPSLHATGKADHYWHLLMGTLPVLRNSIIDHHNDLPTRELQRGISFVESCFSSAAAARARLADVQAALGRLQGTISRFRQLSQRPNIQMAGEVASSFTLSVSGTLCKLLDALQEMVQHLQILRDLPGDIEIPDAFFAVVQTEIEGLRRIQEPLVGICTNVRLTESPLLLKDEYEVLMNAMTHFKDIEQKLLQWSAELPDLKKFILPLHGWLSTHTSTESTPAIIVDPVSQENGDGLIDTLLVVVQSLLAIKPSSSPPTDGEEAPDDYIKEGWALMSKISHALSLATISAKCSLLLQTVVRRPPHEISTSLGRVLPFLHNFMVLAEASYCTLAQWSKSLLKLDYVLCSVVHSLAKDGFCQPADTEEDDDGKEGGEAEGTGLGEGSGAKNVSKEIQDESQVEGLQGESAEDEDVERAEEDNAVEMADDFGGKMQDVPEGEEGEEEEEDGESDEEPDDQIGDLDANDETAVDEKLWGDEKGPEDRDGKSKQSDKDNSTQASDQDDVVAKEKEQEQKKANEKEPQDATPQGEPEQDVDDGNPEEEMQEDQEEPGKDGAPLDDYLQNADTLDLPDDINMDPGQDSQEEGQGDQDVEEDAMSGVEEPDETTGNAPEDMDTGLDEENREGEDDVLPGDDAELTPDNEMEKEVAQPDASAGDGLGDDTTTNAQSSNPDQSIPQEQDDFKAQASGSSQGISNDEKKNKPDVERSESQTMQSELQEMNASSSADAAAGQVQQSSAPPASQSQPKQLTNNPIRSLGDALKEITRRFDDILESETPQPEAKNHVDGGEDSQLEYLREEEADEMQALGPAGPEKSAKLDDLQFAVQEESSVTEGAAPMDINSPEESRQTEVELSSLHAEPSSRNVEGVEGALTPSDFQKLKTSDIGSSDALEGLPSAEISSRSEHDDVNLHVERELREWQLQGQPTDKAEHLWRLYESLTHDLSYALCEQLRLILEPTQATRLKGDYRTGKRLNMKKIIPYIASEYTKDKIWLRRTRPSQREYQVLLALDDSRSMAESHSVHLAYQTLALVSKALSRLEVGDIAIAKFGEAVEVLHGFDKGPFTDQAGTAVLDAFKFDQKATQVLSLVDTSLHLLEQAREQRSSKSSSAADLWQMEIIISDGICQDHERLATVLRKAEEQRVMVVFIILDSLHAKDSGAPGSSGALSAAQNSILSMNQVAYKEVNGKMDLAVTRYLDTFPFEYYVVVRDVEALPDVLAGTLKQFFERISED
ncbi:midasin [Cristinia sonorae]|uniref:Midasin n=1 Tax=Cristinia sonorae TaxID=1940300 RepID=A0A8K0XKY3_9AGAR|nr:midasin [Cristinia sonorae]